MLRFGTRLLLLLHITMLFATVLFAQDKQQQNNAVFEKVRAMIDKQDVEGLYQLTSPEFQNRIGHVNFENFARYGIFAQGALTSASLIDFKDGISTFKTVFPSGDFSLKLSTDSADKINYFLFKKMPSATIPAKTINAYKANKELTGMDKVIEDAATEYINKGNTVGLSVSFLQKGVMRGFSYGETEKGSGQLPGGHAVYQIGSISKTFTATLLAWYANAGKVSLNDPISKYLPDSVKKNKNLAGITLLMLANHTSGLARVPDNLPTQGKDALNPYKNYDKKKLYAYLKRCSLLTQPGVACSYSNTGAGLLGVILEKVSGKSYEEMVHELIAEPLKLESTGIKAHAGHVHATVLGYNEQGKPTPNWDFDALAGCGALRSSASDLARYAEANIDLNTSPIGKALALTHKITYDKEITIGMGWFKKNVGKNSVYWHNGGTFGSSSYLAFVPGKGVALVILSNSAEPVDEMAEKILLAIE